MPGARLFVDRNMLLSSTTKGLTIVDPFAHTPEQILVSP